MIPRKTLTVAAVFLTVLALATPTGAVPVAQQETPTANGTAPDDQTTTEPGTDTETATGTETDTGIEAESETDTDTETAAGTETDTGIEAESETDTGTETTAETNESQVDREPSVTFEDQQSDGQTVTVTNVTLNESGYVAIYDEQTLNTNPVDTVVGVSEYLEAGTHENVTITLFDVPGAEYDPATDDFVENATDPDTTAETESGTETDAETETEAGTATETGTETEAGTATEIDGTTETEAATESTDNTSTDNASTNASQYRLAGDATLEAFVHAETTENETFEYVETSGLADRRIETDGGEFVSDSANVTVVESDTLNGTEITETETGTEAGTETGTETGTTTDAGTETDAGTATETGTETGTATDAGAETDAGTATETGTEIGVGTATETGTDSGL